ncbi:lipoprotein [Kushneria pakistanensis]|uniref:Lipoprotein n=1 Tax=Kushneria pakistanensis TaxID=1508770 RepID=A0ABQ3FPQ2_9GAMM|nr:tripartite tricarboxylate transporter substrate binding protein [Kushneria pakistanensis]GHC32816.1 lipoprotein [Kushneria pakistanensis]
MKKILSVLGAATMLASSMAMAADYPSKNIQFIVPWSAGGGADTAVRAMQPGLEKALGTTIVVRNIGGGGGAVGFSRAVASKPDGYTVTIPTNATFTLEGLGNVAFTRDDFEFIARVLVEPYVMAVRPNDDWSDLESLVNERKASGEPLRMGASGVGSSTHIVSLMLARELGIKMEVIPFDSGSAAVSAAMGGHIDGVVLNPSEVISAIDGNRLKAIVTTGEERSGVLPDAPTMHEAGYDFELAQWRGIAAPKGLDPAIEEQWVEAVKQMVEDPQFQKTARSIGTDVSPLYGEELDQFVERTSKPLIEEAGAIRQ